MTRGILIFAHNNRDVDYALMSCIAGGLAKKSLKLPVSLVTDVSTVNWMLESKIKDKADVIFDKIIVVDKPETSNSRKLHDGSEWKTVPFVNLNRSDAYSLTPYDQTLLIDSDFFIFTDNLNKYWDYSDKVLLGKSANDIVGIERLGYHDRYVSDTSVHLYWATTVMFTKNDYSKHFFELLHYIKNNYQYFADLYRFQPKNYRNDIAFSIAQHILDGYETKPDHHLPSIFSTIDRDTLLSVDQEGKLLFLVNTLKNENNVAATVKDIDIHVMNKISISRHANKLLELI